MSKTLFVSNRLPVSVKKEDQGFIYHESIGGLATGLKRYHQNNDALWIGWPGIAKDTLTKKEQSLLKKDLETHHQCVPVHLTQQDIDLYYEGFSNRTLWPLFHYFIEKAEHDQKTFLAYQAVNEAFYDALKPYIEDDSTIWIHDYQLMLLPAIIRAHHPYVRIGFFLHIPFPSYEVFRLMVWKKEILEGVLGADLIGFHTYDYVRHFLSSVRRILGINHHLYKLKTQERMIAVDAFPMGIDYAFFANHPQKITKNKEQKIILSVDRLDYTKGILERLDAYRCFLETYPKYHQKVKLHLIVAPSRDTLDTYDDLRRNIEKKVSEINGTYGSFEWMPIWYLYQSFDQETLIGHYKSSDILLVTPLRDGMNLIAKEYIASRSDMDGMLIISETAGAASELSEAVIINPNDPEEIARNIKLVLEMTTSDKAHKNRLLHQRLKRYDVNHWANTFMTKLNAIDHHHIKKADEEKVNVDTLITLYQKAERRLMLLDYDGTLVDFKDLPSEATPGKPLKNLLKTLKKDQKNDVVVISGRDHETLDDWLGDLGLHLVGDHGLWYKGSDANWRKTIEIDTAWKTPIMHVMELFSDQMPGSIIEDKGHSIAFHYRRCEPDMIAIKLVELKDALHSIKGNATLEIQQGHMVIEVKDQRINKGTASMLFTRNKTYDFILIIGDDTTDEDMFKTHQNAYTIKVGYGETHAKKRLFSVKDVHQLLSQLSKNNTV